MDQTDELPGGHFGHEPNLLFQFGRQLQSLLMDAWRSGRLGQSGVRFLLLSLRNPAHRTSRPGREGPESAALAFLMFGRF